MATIHEDAWFSVKIIVNDEGKIKQVQRKIECVKTYNSVSDLWEKLDLGLGYDSSNGSIPVECKVGKNEDGPLLKCKISELKNG